MKIAVECQSPLMQKSLEIFLDTYLSSKKKCDIVIRDIECLNDAKCFYVSSDKKADLIKPFSKAQLLMSLEKRYVEMNLHVDEEEDVEEERMGFDILERRIESLTQEYQQNIIKAVKAFYEK